MPRELYNEGRVRGESCYEAYVKNALEEDPNTQPVSEREWLASTLAMGSSMLLKIDPFTPEKEDNIVKDYKLPDESSLIAPSTIIASFFAANPSDFSGIYDDTGWVTQVGSYGDLLVNNSTEPKNGGTYSWTSDSMTEEEKTRLLNYMRIQDGLVLQDGTWETRTASNNPKRILKQPNFKNSPTVRIRFAHEVTTSFFVLLTGFVTFGVVIGESGFGGGAADTANPYNGDFLGPAVFPWANKIMFHTSASMAYQSQTSIKAGDGTNVEIVTDPDSFDTYIRVKNLIESESEPYLTVWQDDPDGYAGWTKLTLNMDELLDWIASNMSGLIEAGKGIIVEEKKDGSGNVTGVVISGWELEPGIGISITEDEKNGKYTIENTMATDKFYTIANMNGGGSYQSFHGNWTTGYDGSSWKAADTSKNVWIRWFNNFYMAKDDGGASVDTLSSTDNRGVFTLTWQPSYTTEAGTGTKKLTSARIKISSGDWKLHCAGNIGNSSAYKFGHQHGLSKDVDSDWEEWEQCALCVIYFPKDSTEFAPLSYSTTHILSTSCEPDVWTILRNYGTSTSPSWGGFGGSWNVNLGVEEIPSNFPGYISENYTGYVIRTYNIADGYNDQYYNNPYDTYASSSSGLRAGSLCVHLEWTVMLA